MLRNKNLLKLTVVGLLFARSIAMADCTVIDSTSYIQCSDTTALFQNSTNSSINRLGNQTVISFLPLSNTDRVINEGVISGVYSAIYFNSSSSVNTLINEGTIHSQFFYGIFNNGLTQNVINSGLISTDFRLASFGNGTNGIINNFINTSTGRIISVSVGINNNLLIRNLENAGLISADFDGISNLGGTIETLTNTGTILGARYGVSNYQPEHSVINNLNNLQGSGNDSGALQYQGILPVKYNIIINDSTHYGQIDGSSGVAETTTFGVYSGSNVTSRLYTGVLKSLASSNVAGSGSTRTGTFDGMTWTLTETVSTAGSENWDLSFTGVSIVQTQSSLHNLASRLRGAFSSQAVATNFANMNTYDCNLFDSRGLCISVGGQQTYVDNPSSNLTSTVAVAGYKVSPTLRIGGFLNQNLNNHTNANVDISNANPLMGLFAVWNQNKDHLGYQVKVANAYQDKDVTTMRDAVGTSEAGRGSTELNTQSYVGELSYAFMANQDKTLVRPYAAVRYTRIKQDGYTERTTATVTAPLTYSALSDRSTAALVGVKLNHKLAEKVNLTGSLGVEQDLHHHVDNLTATGVSGLTSESFNGNIKRTRPVASIGAYYMPAKNQRIAADVYYQQLPFQSTGSTTAYVNYTLGF